MIAGPHIAAGQLKMDLEKKMWTAGFRFSWRKMKMAAQDRAEWKTRD